MPAMLLEVDRVTEPADDLHPYQDWFELLAPEADANKERAAQGAAVHDFRPWSRIYPPTGGWEGYVPLAFVLTGKTDAQRESRMRWLEQVTRTYVAGAPPPSRRPGGSRRSPERRRPLHGPTRLPVPRRLGPCCSSAAQN
ncbi:hypothetical protein ACGFZL_14200 [Streptomyces sp. NPDC048182]|uniref:hypothetical protein n=1 Tax=Streptomyces sp. NPDC048182 TaxID=3365507 RepID=UPI00371D2D7A